MRLVGSRILPWSFDADPDLFASNVGVMGVEITLRLLQARIRLFLETSVLLI